MAWCISFDFCLKLRNTYCCSWESLGLLLHLWIPVGNKHFLNIVLLFVCLFTYSFIRINLFLLVAKKWKAMGRAIEGLPVSSQKFMLGFPDVFFMCPSMTLPAFVSELQCHLSRFYLYCQNSWGAKCSTTYW